jgi:hypothetical protein
MKRALTEAERLVIARIAERLSEDRRNQLLVDMANATAEPAGESGSRIMFDITGYSRPLYKGQHSFGVEGRLLDKDGAKVALDLYADENDRLLELEIIREDLRTVIDPDWNSLTLF